MLSKRRRARRLRSVFVGGARASAWNDLARLKASTLSACQAALAGSLRLGTQWKAKPPRSSA